MATKTQDYTKMMQEMMASFPGDMSSIQESFKSYASFGEKMSKVVLDAAGKSTEVSSQWTMETLSKMNDMAVARDEPSDYGKAMSEFASSQAEMTAETMASFAEIAKKVQMETVELMLAAGKDMSEDMTAATKKATNEASSAAKKAASTAK
ncbi:phasin protein [Palleronia aestuarii]|uniref:Phasin protein n=1 Tax=Palleronia aestuarii TaxID=568105 RepID=A0A2W7ND41_9RHOB|nr:phasin family protein [Palleronia aestuarii]PZX18295.1 phasin protein [Palleronia aestuarii]